MRLGVLEHAWRGNQEAVEGGQPVRACVRACVACVRGVRACVRGVFDPEGCAAGPAEETAIPTPLRPKHGCKPNPLCTLR